MVWLFIALLCCAIGFQFFYIYNMKQRLREISSTLDDVCNGNLDRRLLANENTVTSDLVYKINDIVIRDKNRLLKADKAEQAYKKLVTSLSHDIRTPLASLIGYLEALENDSCRQQERIHFLKTAKTKALNLSDYIQVLFEWLKLESGEWVYHFDKENICEQTRLILADWIIRLERNEIRFQFDIPEEAIFFVMDTNVYERIINNLMSNMVKYSKADVVKVTLGYNQSEICIEITDNGVGISEEYLPFIFERLYKCDSSRTDSGNGLGLAITKELVSVLGGSIAVKSEWNKGTTFVIKLPNKHE